mmetsp:Transcript_6527/g.15019  ORF Transcript_6527/g.15019 Transcript_6527/m.15019 type:complete len:91 (-) Transcript_6527:74-346(-)
MPSGVPRSAASTAGGRAEMVMLCSNVSQLVAQTTLTTCRVCFCDGAAMALLMPVASCTQNMQNARQQSATKTKKQHEKNKKGLTAVEGCD